MKNIKFTVIGVTTLSVAFILNAKHAIENYGVLNNDLHVEVLAQSNSSGGDGSGSGSGSGSVDWNHWSQWLTQGLTKDEREEKRPCPSETSSSGSGGVSVDTGGVSGGVSGSGSSYQSNPSGREEYICPQGNTNCTAIGC